MSAKVILARSAEGNSALALELEKVGIKAIKVPTIVFAPPEDWSAVDKELKSIRDYDWVLFTSATCARFFLDRIDFLGIHLPEVQIATVGPKTAAVLEGKGIKVNFIPSSFTTQSLARELPRNGTKILLFRADIADESMLSSLEQRGFKVKQVAIYRSLAARSMNNYEELYDAKAILFGSASEVRNFCKIVPEELLDKLKGSSVAACIGPITAEQAKASGFSNILIPEKYTFDSLIRELINYVK